MPLAYNVFLFWRRWQGGAAPQKLAEPSGTLGGGTGGFLLLVPSFLLCSHVHRLINGHAGNGPSFNLRAVSVISERLLIQLIMHGTNEAALKHLSLQGETSKTGLETRTALSTLLESEASDAAVSS